MSDSKTWVVCERDPDYSNEFTAYGPADVGFVDIDYGHSNLNDPDEREEWARGLIDSVRTLPRDVMTHVAEAVIREYERRNADMSAIRAELAVLRSAWDVEELISTIRGQRPELEVRWEHTGGGVGTLFVGAGVWGILVGPGDYERRELARESTCVGTDAEASVDVPEDLTPDELAAMIIAACDQRDIAGRRRELGWYVEVHNRDQDTRWVIPVDGEDSAGRLVQQIRAALSWLGMGDWCEAQQFAFDRVADVVEYLGHLLEASEIECGWFAGCARPAATFSAHPILGAVPICQECSEGFLTPLGEK